MLVVVVVVVGVVVVAVGKSFNFATLKNDQLELIRLVIGYQTVMLKKTIALNMI